MKISTIAIRNAPVRWPIYLLVLFMGCFIYAAIVPPFQSPDEFDHVARAYMLGHGDVVLHSENGAPSGGSIDAGLANYMDLFRPLVGKGDRKLSADEQNLAGSVTWTGKTVRVFPIVTSYYFPAMYLPQAIGLTTGEVVGLSVSQAYRLARYTTLACVIGLLWLAFRIFPPPAAVVAILFLPMGMFLTSGVILDAVATATAVVGLSAFMRVITDGRATPPWVLWTMVICISLVGACRANSIPFLLLLFGALWVTRERKLLIASLTSSILVLAWTLVSIKRVVYPVGDARTVDHAARLAHFVLHPWEFLGILSTTLASKPIQGYYVTSYIGSLGWLDSSFSDGTYYALGFLLLGTFVFGLSRDALSEHRLLRLTLAICAIAMVLLTFLAMLVQWTVGMPDVIQGVQGRYFIIPTIALAYALLGDAHPRVGAMERISAFLVVALAVVSIYTTTQLIVTRYYTPLTQAGASVKTLLAPSPVLTPDRPIPVRFGADILATPQALQSVEIMFGTYGRVNQGEGTVMLWTSSGEHTDFNFDLSSMKDNAYLSVPLDGKRYIGGEVRVTGGEGISSGEIHVGDQTVITCMKLHFVNGTSRATAGCPE